jgi:hypothetical protein
VGVNIFILDRRPATLSVAGVTQNVGSLRRFWKITEIDEERAGELSASETAASAMPSPKAAMVADIVEMPCGESGVEVKAHEVIGWDEGRTRVTDMGWDYLPVLGYAVRNRDNGVFVLHERRNGVLYPLDRDRTVELGLTGPDGQLVRRGQPVISECRSVRLYIPGYAEADCTFDNGRKEKLLIGIGHGSLPEATWITGKTPAQLEQHLPARPASSTAPPGGNSPRR